MIQLGNKWCEICNGQGIVKGVTGWRPCDCVRGTSQQRRMMREFNTGDKPFIPLSQRMKGKGNNG